MRQLPDLAQMIDSGAAGGHEFERLMHQLLLGYADRERFSYEPLSGPGGDKGLDGFAYSGIPGLKGPVGFQFKWLWGSINKGHKARQIKESLERIKEVEFAVNHWVLVTPRDLSPSERSWLLSLPRPPAVELHHWGKLRVENLLRAVPALFSRYYPLEASEFIVGYEGFDFQTFSRQYKQKVVLAYQKLNTLGLPPEAMRERDARSDIPLRDIFVPLNLLPEREAGESQSIGDVLVYRNSTVVLGDPGTGKSTLLAFLALLFSGGASLPGYVSPTEVVPLLIPLRDFVRMQLGNPSLSFLGYLENRARSDYSLGHAHHVFFESKLRMGEAIVLIDGLDEVGNEATKYRIASAILAFQEEYPACPFWVTSRIYGYTSAVRLRGRFVHARLGRLDDNQINNFVESWYSLQSPNNERERTERVQSLLRAVHRTQSVKRLAGNPLLLTLMAFIHQGLRRLPQDRGELYDKCVEMLLKTWQQAKFEEGSGFAASSIEALSLHLHTQKDYLAHLAMHAQERSVGLGDSDARGLLPRKEVLDCLAKRHMERSLRTRPDLTYGEAWEEMSHFLDYVSDRTGLLIDRGGEQLSFIHLSFQEYLAAWIFTCGTGGAAISFFEQHLGDPWWEEVILLRLYIVLRTSGGGGEQVFDAIISTLLRGLEKRESEKGWLTLARALRDNLDFAARDQEVILRKSVEFWLRTPNVTGEWFLTLEEICFFTEGPRDRLRKILSESIVHLSASDCVACFHLIDRFFGISDDLIGALMGRRDLSLLLPDLALFLGDERFSSLALHSAGFKAWLGALSTLVALEPSSEYRLSLVWSSRSPDELPVSDDLYNSALCVLWSKIFEELLSRSRLSLKFNGDYPFGVVGSISLKSDFHEVKMPLGSLRVPCIDAVSVFSISPARGSASDLLCPSLASLKISALSGATQGLDKTLSNWMFEFVKHKLGDKWLVGARELIGGVVEHFSFRPQGELVYFLEGQGIDVAEGILFSRGWYSSRGSWLEAEVLGTFAMDIADYYGRVYARSLFKGFGADLGVGFSSEFGNMDSLKFSSRLISLMGQTFGRFFAKKLGVPSELRLWESSVIAALENDDVRANLFSSDHFWSTSVLSLEPSIDFARGSDFLVKVKNPCAVPLALSHLWLAAAISHIFGLVGYLESAGVTKETIRPMAYGWLRRHPLELYAAAFACNERAREFREIGGNLRGSQGALALSHVAYLTLMTGLPCYGESWRTLIEEREVGNPLLEASYLIGRICSRQGGQRTMEELLRTIKKSRSCQQLLEAIGVTLL